MRNRSMQLAGGHLHIQRIVTQPGLLSLPPASLPSLHIRASGTTQVMIGLIEQPALWFAGGYVFVPAQCALQIRTTSPVERWSVSIDLSNASEALGIALPDDYRAPRHDAALDCFFQLMNHHLHGVQTMDMDVIEVYERLLMMQLGRMFGDGRYRAEVTSDSEQILRLGEFIDQRLAYNLAVEDMARFLDLSKFKLLRLLRKALNTTPQQFIIERRMGRAKQLLIDSQEDLTDIALATGFSSQSHFTSAFSAAMGVSPGAFRQAHRAS